MPDTPTPEDETASDLQSQEEAVYGEGDGGQVNEDLLHALKPTEDDYAPFSPPEPPPSIDPPSDPSEEAPDDDSMPSEFDPRWRDEFSGLLYLGRLQRSFSWMGHRFTIKSLGTDEILAISLVQKPYIGQMGEMKAYQSAAVAASLVDVDGKPLPIPLSKSPDPYDEVRAKFDYVIRTYSPIIIDVIYNATLELEQKVNEVIIAMGKAYG